MVSGAVQLVDELLELPQIWNLQVRPPGKKLRRGSKNIRFHTWVLSSASTEREDFRKWLWLKLHFSLLVQRQVVFSHWCCEKGITPCETTVRQLTYFVFLRRKRGALGSIQELLKGGCIRSQCYCMVGGEGGVDSQSADLYLFIYLLIFIFILFYFILFFFFAEKKNPLSQNVCFLSYTLQSERK